ncbi:MAG: N-acetyltransferase family protein [Acidocella sp.]|uniref:GNAT family N-acetyltransferase n=1 Tax=Acidocella sp. TaxID=50710 RepID=UPI003FBFC6DF
MTAVSLRMAVPEDAQQLGAVHVASWRESYAGLLPEGMLATLSAERRAATWSTMRGNKHFLASSSVWVAAEGSLIVGFASCGAQRDQSLRDQGFDAEFNAIYILRSHQGTGLGWALMRAMAATLREQACRAAALWILTKNKNARCLYERQGGILIAEKEVARPQAILVEVAYG